jgi:hypothetical protein
VTLVAVATFFSGCAQTPPTLTSSRQGIENNGDKNPTRSAVLASEGEVLYQKYCLGCHGAFATSTKRNISASQLTNAMAQQPAMIGLTLTDYQIKTIVISLSDVVKESRTTLLPTNNDLANFDAGALLYTQKCLTCHGAIETSSKRNTTSLKITNALLGVLMMASVRVTDVEKEYIVFALSHSRAEFLSAAAPIVYRDVLTVVSPAKNRNLLGDKLKWLFATDQSNVVNTTIYAFITSNIVNKPIQMGGLCFHLFDTGCPGPVSMTSTNIPFEMAMARMEPQTDAIREGLLVNTCLKMATNTTAIANALAKAGLTTASNLTSANIEAMWNVMSPETASDDRTDFDVMLASITSVATKSATAGATKTTIWTDIITSYCQSPLMETY